MSWLEGRTIHQVMVTAAPGDAVTRSAMEIRELLRVNGDSEVFAFHIDPDLRSDVLSTSDFEGHSPSEPDPLTLVHISFGDDQLLPFLARLEGKLILSYHNITPSSYFSAWDPETARHLESGRAALGAVRDRTVLALADSEFNAADLRNLGFPVVRVGGLLLGVEELVSVEPTPLPAAPGRPVVLSVSQLFPHKRADLVLAAFHELVHTHLPDAYLVLAGSARLPSYAAAISQYVEHLELGSQVKVTGHISDAELAGWYRSADIFVIASEHEGFCVPLVEAMNFDLPIAARANGAVAETLGGAGVLVPGNTGPSALAAVIAEVVQDPLACEALRERGRSRRAAFSAKACKTQFIEALKGTTLAEMD